MVNGDILPSQACRRGGVQIVSTFKQRTPQSPYRSRPRPIPPTPTGPRSFFGGRISRSAPTPRIPTRRGVWFGSSRLPDPTFTKHYTNYVQPQRPVMNYDRLPRKIAPGFTPS